MRGISSFERGLVRDPPFRRKWLNQCMMSVNTSTESSYEISISMKNFSSERRTFKSIDSAARQLEVTNRGTGPCALYSRDKT